MYITINDVIGEKRIGLSYPIHPRKEALGPRSMQIAVIAMLSNNIQYEVIKPRTIMDPISNTKKLIPSKTYAGRELISMLEEWLNLPTLKLMIKLLRRIS